LKVLTLRHQWVGEIEAADEREAIESTKEFKQPAKKLMAVQR
jgi:hypothetical protein